ncbi:MAG: 6-phosphogluconolactonase [Bacteroidota bacterium]
MTFPKRIFPSPEAVAEAFAERLVQLIKEQDHLTVALSGGSTPKLLFRLLAEKYRSAVDWSRIHIFWGDERCVPPNDADSNYGMTHDLWLAHVDIPEQNIHRVRGEDDPASEAKRYASLIKDSLPMTEQWPQFDLIILGMGADGHTASIFPHQIDLLQSPDVCAVATHPESGQKRISLTGEVLNCAKEVIFLVTGASKTPVLEEIFGQIGNWQSYPAAHIHPSGSLVWYLDEAAWTS